MAKIGMLGYSGFVSMSARGDTRSYYGFLNEIDYQEDTDLEDNEEDFFIGVYNVGQGLCSAICNYKSQPMLYFDFGGGERKDIVAYPEDIKYCFSQKPKIILSHLHRDQWIGANRCEEALEMEWVVPPQKEKGAQVNFISLVIKCKD
jgi:hypothetical protein